MKKIVVKHDSLLLDYLINDLAYSRNNAKKILSSKSVIINEKCVSKFDYQLNKGDTFLIGSGIVVNDKYDLEIIYEDDDLIAINKKAGLLSIATSKEKENTAYKMVMNYLKDKDKHNKVFVLHRLDKETSGVLVFAKNEKVKKILQENWNSIVLKRGYYAVVKGILDKKEDCITNYLKENRERIVYVCDEFNKYGKKAITSYKVLKENKNSLIDINIKTGRKNQIRVTFANLDHHVLGDKKYAVKEENEERLFLHAYELSFINPINHKYYTFKTNLPNSFEKRV